MSNFQIQIFSFIIWFDFGSKREILICALFFTIYKGFVGKEVKKKIMNKRHLNNLFYLVKYHLQMEGYSNRKISIQKWKQINWNMKK